MKKSTLIFAILCTLLIACKKNPTPAPTPVQFNQSLLLGAAWNLSEADLIDANGVKTVKAATDRNIGILNFLNATFTTAPTGTAAGTGTSLDMNGAFTWTSPAGSNTIVLLQAQYNNFMQTMTVTNLTSNQLTLEVTNFAYGSTTYAKIDQLYTR